MTRDLVVGRWGARFAGRRFPCAIGRGGIGAKRREGDGITPAGRHRIEAVLWRPDRGRAPCLAASALPASRIGPFDGWSDDPRDPGYNGPVRRPHPFRNERLRRADGLYDLLAALDFNRRPAEPGLGSAIFLHVWRGPRRPTDGCIGFRRGDLAWILARWNRNGRVIVVA